jgi:hypothetical protein
MEDKKVSGIGTIEVVLDFDEYPALLLRSTPQCGTSSPMSSVLIFLLFFQLMHISGSNSSELWTSGMSLIIQSFRAYIAELYLHP